jgi:hypothetical protein
MRPGCQLWFTASVVFPAVYWCAQHLQARQPGRPLPRARFNIVFDFEAVDVSGLMIDPDSGEAKQSTTVSVTVIPSTATVPVNTTMQFTATVTNAPTQVVDWRVNGAAEGNSTMGWTSSGGLYAAPVVTPPSGSVTVQAAKQCLSLCHRKRNRHHL